MKRRTKSREREPSQADRKAQDCDVGRPLRGRRSGAGIRAVAAAVGQLSAAKSERRRLFSSSLREVPHFVEPAPRTANTEGEQAHGRRF